LKNQQESAPEMDNSVKPIDWVAKHKLSRIISVSENGTKHVDKTFFAHRMGIKKHQNPKPEIACFRFYTCLS